MPPLLADVCISDGGVTLIVGACSTLWGCIVWLHRESIDHLQGQIDKQHKTINRLLKIVLPAESDDSAGDDSKADA